MSIGRIGAVIEARMGSSRLPGKVMKDLAGAPLLQQLIRRVARSRRIDGLTVATTTDDSDDLIADLSKEMGIPCFRGSELNILERVVHAAKESKYDVVLRLTGDNPLYDGALIDRMVAFYLENDFDLVANAAMGHVKEWLEERTFPLGLGVQIVSLELLEERCQNSPSDIEKEHVTVGILQSPDKYRLGAFHAVDHLLPLRRPQYRLTVDTLEDYQLVSELFSLLYPRDHDFSIFEVIELLDSRPDLVSINLQVNQKPLGS